MWVLLGVIILCIVLVLVKQTKGGGKMYTKISHKEAKDLIDSGVTIIDVREPYEYAEAHIEGAKNIPLAGLENLITEAAPDKDKPLLVHCLSGMRSQAGAKKLIALGYTKVYDFGGIQGWPFGLVK